MTERCRLTTLLHEGGVAAAVAQALIGHDSEQIHNDYINVGRDALKRAVATLPTHSGPVTLNPRWLRIPAAVKYSGLSRSRLYELLSAGEIRSICLKSHKRAERGVRLLDRESIDSFMLALQTKAVSE